MRRNASEKREPSSIYSHHSLPWHILKGSINTYTKYGPGMPYVNLFEYYVTPGKLCRDRVFLSHILSLTAQNVMFVFSVLSKIFNISDTLLKFKFKFRKHNYTLFILGKSCYATVSRLAILRENLDERLLKERKKEKIHFWGPRV